MCFVFCRLGVVPVFLVALIITLVLVFFPRTSETIPPFQEAEVFRYLIIKVNAGSALCVIMGLRSRGYTDRQSLCYQNGFTLFC